MIFFSKLDAIVKSLTGAILFIMTSIVIVDVFFRYIMNAPVVEFQEFSISCMVYLVMLGCSTAVYNKSHLAVEYFIDKFTDANKKMVQILIYSIMICFFAVLMVKGFALTIRSMSQISAATGIPAGYVVFSLPLGSFLSIIYLAMHIFTILTKK